MAATFMPLTLVQPLVMCEAKKGKLLTSLQVAPIVLI